MDVPPGFEPDEQGPLAAPPGFEPDQPDSPAMPAKRSRFGARFKPEEPGDSPENPIDEQHPDIGWWDRTKIKNWSANPEVSARYLQQNGFEAAPNPEGEIVVRRPGGKFYKLESSGAEWSDITDIGSDVVSGVAQTAAAVPAAAAAIPSGPIGMLAAGAAASGATAAGIEGLKQATAPMMGFDPSPSEAFGAIGREGLWGAASVPIGAGIAKGVGLAAKGVGKVAGKAAPFLGGLGKRLQRPLEREKVVGDYGEAISERLGGQEGKIAADEAQHGLTGDIRGIEAEIYAKRGQIAQEGRAMKESGRQAAIRRAEKMEAEQAVMPEAQRLEELTAARQMAEEKLLAEGIAQAPVRSAAKTGVEEASITEGKELGRIAPEELALQQQTGVHTRAKATLTRAQADRAREIREAAENAEGDAERYIQEARQITVTHTVKKSTRISGDPVGWDPKKLHPAWSFRADFLRRFPILLVPYRKAWGDRLVRLVSEEVAEDAGLLGKEAVKTGQGVITSSISMANRAKFENAFVQEFGKEAGEKARRVWWESMSGILLKHPDLNERLSKDEIDVLLRLFQGTATKADAAKFTTITDKMVITGSGRDIGELAVRELEERAGKFERTADVEETGEALVEKQAKLAARTGQQEVESGARQAIDPLKLEKDVAKLAEMEMKREMGPTGAAGGAVSGAKRALQEELTRGARAKAGPQMLQFQRDLGDLNQRLLAARHASKLAKAPGGAHFESRAAAFPKELKAKQKQILVSKFDPRTDPYAQFKARWLGNMMPGFLRDLFAKDADEAARKLLAGIGRTIDSAGSKASGLKRLLPILKGIKSQAEKHGNKAAMATVYLYGKSDPEFQSWLRGLTE